MRWAVALGIALVACGRSGFDGADDARAMNGDARMDGPSDGLSDASIDAPPNAVTRTYGRRTGVDVVVVVNDTYISNDTGEPTLNHGLADDLRSEGDKDERILLRFDLTAIPTSAQVFSANVTVHVIQFDATATLTARLILQNWAEGTGDGTVGVANFTQRDTGLAWDTVGAGSPGSSGAIVGSAMPVALADLTMALEPSAVQPWVTTPALNFGLVFFNSSAATVRFASSEATVATQRPMLTVTYVP